VTTAADPHREECTMKHTKTITILHSNDLHGDFLAEQVDEKLVGGVSMLSGYIEKVRAEQPNTIYVIAGDMFRGSVIDSEYKGLSTIEIMNALAPDVVTIGNHEVDYGIAHLLFIEKCARFPIINANLYIKNTPTRLFTPYKILRMDGMNILFIGIITQDVINQTKSESLVGSFVDTAAAAAEVGKICNAHNSIDIDFTVLLTHIGFEEDRHLARQLDPAWGVDLIIGGHSHTLPEHAVEENGVVIAQAGTGTDEIGRFDIMVDTDLNAIDTFTWQMVPIDDAHCPRDEEVENFIQRYRSATSQKYDRIITRLSCELTHPKRNQETALGDLIADILRDSFGIDLMLMGSGAIRSYALGPVVHYADLVECLPYDDAVYMLKVTGTQLERMIRHILRDEAFQGEHTEFYQFSHGTHIVWSRSEQAFRTLTLDGEALYAERLYTVAVQKYHYNNLKPFLDITLEEVEKNGKIRVLSTSARDVVEEYLTVNQHLSGEVEGRLVVED
jgi:5'-nucleotidase/UDP-sugar diphosphatase